MAYQPSTQVLQGFYTTLGLSQTNAGDFSTIVCPPAGNRAPACHRVTKHPQGGVMKTHKARAFLRAVAVLAVAVTGSSLAQAQSCNVEWTGNVGDGQWSTAGNWSTHRVPGTTNDVCILTANGTSGSVDAIATPSIAV